MKVGFIVDGQSEYYALPGLISRIPTDAQLLRPLVADLQPLAPLGQIARAVLPKARILAARNVDLIVLLLDNETITSCPGEHAIQLADTVQELLGPSPVVAVVKKVQTLENWLVADPDAVAGLRGRFTLSERQRSSILPDKADHISAIRLLGSAAIDRAYAKVKDSARILTVADPLKMASNSRSFRRLLRVLRVEQYSGQSRLPH
jgi:hypothetical protein